MTKRDVRTGGGMTMSRLLISGFILMLLPITVLVIGTIKETDAIADLTKNMYRHPLTVSTAVLEVNAKILAMHRHMKDVTLARSDEELSLAISAVDRNEKKVYGHFEVILERFLGDKSKIEKALNSFKDWKAIRAKVINLTRNGQRNEAADITKGIGAKHVELMTVRMESLIDFARDKASEFLVTSQERQESSRITLYWLVAVVVALWGSISFFVVIRVRLAEGELLASRDEAQRANNAKSQFLASMSHDLRTPLNAIMGFSDMIVHKVFGPVGDVRYEEYATDIRNSGEFLVSMVNDVLDLSKIESGNYDLENASLDIESLFNEVMRMVEPQAREGGIETRVEISDGVPHLRADKRAISQIFINLLSNSVKFTKQGGTIKASANLDEDGFLCLHVSDTGIGMSSEEIELSFKPFTQANSQVSRKHEGSGLGLYLCRQLVQLHDATLTIQSKEGKGTKVTVMFPKERIAGLRLVS